MSDSNMSNAFFLQPHLLTKVSLIQSLEQKCMNIKHLNTMTKQQLVELFQRIALPLPQRKYRQNFRGKLLTRAQNARESLKKDLDKNLQCASIGFGELNSAGEKVGIGVSDRLKPPPNTVNYERKRIRLNCGGNKSSDLDHIQIKRRKSEDTNGLLDNAEKCDTTISITKESANVVLKRSFSASTKCEDTPQPGKKKEKKLITWP